MARYAESGVILVGDIDRGGTYASFIGHLEVMEEWERQLVRGFLVNKFRGDARLLKDAHDYLDTYTGKPVVGVMPYRRDHRLPEEDGVDFDLRYGGDGGETLLTVGVVALPHISNSTDVDPLLNYPRVKLKQLRRAEDLNGVHLVIIPGSKNVIHDFNFMKESGLSDRIIQGHGEGRMCVLGICGGFQMLGRRIEDPLGIETTAGNSVDAMGLLEAVTVLAETKTLALTETGCDFAGGPVKGYEIHHGISSYSPGGELFTTSGLGAAGERCWGTYLHGILENRGFIESVLLASAASWGISPDGLLFNDFDLEGAIDAFAEVFNQSVDVDGLLDFSGLKK